MTPAGFDACWRALAGFPGYAALPKTDIPTRICSFAADRSTPPRVGAMLSDKLREIFAVGPHSVIDGAGHMGVLTHPVALAAHLTAHWQASDADTLAGGTA